jgi:hypothetical protein
MTLAWPTARVLAEWPVTAWGPILDVLRLLLLYAPINRHYASSSGNPVPVIIRRCILKPDAPRALQLRALFVVGCLWTAAPFMHPLMLDALCAIL